MTKDITERHRILANEFSARFGNEPLIFEHAPGRVDLMGSHTDYNQGHVLTLPIDRDTWIAARPRSDRQVVIHSLDLAGVGSFNLDDIHPDPDTTWSNYVRGVAIALQSEGYKLAGFDGLIHSTIPLRSGLSSSAALEVATARLFNRLGNLGVDPVHLALLCQQAENNFVGMNCGILDQYTSSVGQVGSALLLDCRFLTSKPISLPENLSVVICDTRSHRELTGSEYPERRAACEQGAQIFAKYYPSVKTLRDVSPEMLSDSRAALPAIIEKRVQFIIEEEQRVLDLTAALASENLKTVHALAAASFTGARDLYEICTPEMEAMYSAMTTSPGGIGARQAGAGFGGCMVAFVESALLDQFADSVEQHYQAATGISPLVYKVA